MMGIETVVNETHRWDDFKIGFKHSHYFGDVAHATYKEAQKRDILYDFSFEKWDEMCAVPEIVKKGEKVEALHDEIPDGFRHRFFGGLGRFFGFITSPKCYISAYNMLKTGLVLGKRVAWHERRVSKEMAKRRSYREQAYEVEEIAIKEKHMQEEEALYGMVFGGASVEFAAGLVGMYANLPFSLAAEKWHNVHVRSFYDEFKCRYQPEMVQEKTHPKGVFERKITLPDMTVHEVVKRKKVYQMIDHADGTQSYTRVGRFGRKKKLSKKKFDRKIAKLLGGTDFM